ncbi:MAG: hypothetical protein E6R03_04300 [Hyphomicrobiaceae bacterium]|nr:MAG: hypothetical protein E6R03_04300 [Hyphomicrobiaceae bacterium]
MNEIPILLTNYWPLDEDGQFVPWNYQADATPHLTANGTELSRELEWLVAACIDEWNSIGWTTAVSFYYDGEYRRVLCEDEFGAPGYWNPFYHPRWGWVIPVDVFTAEPVYEIIYLWDREVGESYCCRQ